MSVYNDENGENLYSPDGSQDNLDQSPEERDEQDDEIANLEDGLDSPEDSQSGAGSSSDKDEKDSASGKNGKPRRRLPMTPEQREKAELNKKLQDTKKDLAAKDKENDSLFKDKDIRKKVKVGGNRLSSFGRNRKLLAGAGVGFIGFAIAGMGLFGFLNVFRLDHLLNNIDSETFSRYNATFEERSDSWMRAYVRLRLGEMDGTIKPDSDGNVFFRSNRVNTGNPGWDWYRTMRTSKFEDDLLQKHGIRFTSVIDANGRIRPARIEIKGQPTIEIKVDGVDANLDMRTAKGPEFDKALNQIDTSLRKTDILKTDKEARKAIAKAVDENTRFKNVIKRRQLRKDQTYCEKIVWHYLRDRRFLGFKFRR